MRYAILSDIHGNDEALSAVFRDIAQVKDEYGAPMDQIWCLGDVVGYGPEPSECVRRIRSSCDICIAGNHDWAAIEKLDLSDFSKSAAASARWTRNQLKIEEPMRVLAHQHQLFTDVSSPHLKSTLSVTHRDSHQNPN